MTRVVRGEVGVGLSAVVDSVWMFESFSHYNSCLQLRPRSAARVAYLYQAGVGARPLRGGGVLDLVLLSLSLSCE